MKKIDISIDVKASGFGTNGRMFSHDHIDKEIKGVKELTKVFNGGNFKLE